MVLLRRTVVQFWMLFAVLVFAELFVFAKLPAALLRGAVPLNPLGWFGYGELGEVSVERTVDPAAYWMIVSVLTMAAMMLGFFIYMLGVHSIATAGP
jgi:hypothetical protein